MTFCFKFLEIDVSMTDFSAFFSLINAFKAINTIPTIVLAVSPSVDMTYCHCHSVYNCVPNSTGVFSLNHESFMSIMFNFQAFKILQAIFIFCVTSIFYILLRLPYGPA